MPSNGWTNTLVLSLDGSRIWCGFRGRQYSLSSRRTRRVFVWTGKYYLGQVSKVDFFYRHDADTESTLYSFLKPKSAATAHRGLCDHYGSLVLASAL